MKNDLLIGLAWFAVLLGIDIGTSVDNLDQALSKASHDPVAAALVQKAVIMVLSGVLLAYVFMGVCAGVLIHLVRRTRSSAHPWCDRLVLIGAVSLWMTLRTSIMYPLLYIGPPGLDWWASHINPSWLDAAFGLAGVAWLARGWRDNRPSFAWPMGLAVATLAVALADNHLPASTPRHNEGPNVVIIGIDGLRPDHLARNGYTRNTAPALDEWLGTAEVFEDAVTPLARTWPAWNTILTGTGPTTHGKRWSLPAPGDEMPDVPMLSQVLQADGYHTRFVTDDSRFSYMLPEHGFDSISEPMVNMGAFAVSGYNPHFRAFATFLNGPLGWALAPVYKYNQAFGYTWNPAQFAEHVADELGLASRHERFFVAIHACTLHAPGSRPWPYHTMYGIPEYEGNNRYRYRSTGSAIADGDDVDPEALERAEASSRQQNLDLYDAGIAMVDETFARIERALDEGGVGDNTLVVVLSDHGEEFYEDASHYRFRGPNHGFHPWGTGQHRVLLALRGKGFEPGTRTELVSLADVAPTIARFLGVDFVAEGLPLQDPVPERLMYGETGESESGYWAEGHRTVPIERLGQRYGVDPDTLRVYQRHEVDLAMIDAKDHWVLDSRRWLVMENMVAGPRFALFDWHADPSFHADISDREPEERHRLVQALATLLTGELDIPEASDVAHLDEPIDDDARTGAFPEAQSTASP